MAIRRADQAGDERGGAGTLHTESSRVLVLPSGRRRVKLLHYLGEQWVPVRVVEDLLRDEGAGEPAETEADRAS